MTIAMLMLAAGVGAAMTPMKLTCEGLVEPTIGAGAPRLGWLLRDERRGAKQTAYQIRVSSKAGEQGDLWDSGKIASSRTFHVPYEGKPIAPGARAFWRVRVWDQDDLASSWSEESSFARGLESWVARWIEDATPVEPLSPARNGFHSQMAGTPEAEKWVEIDLGEEREFDEIRLHPARPIDWVRDAPGFLFPIRFQVIADGRVAWDASAAAMPNPGDQVVIHRPSRTSARVVRLVVKEMAARETGAYGIALAEMELLLDGRVVSQGAAVKASDSIEQNFWSTRYLTDGITQSQRARGVEALQSPTLRKTFRIEKPVARAMAYVACLGLYELRLNGNRVSEEVLAPDWTDHHRRVLARAYDVTDRLREGEHVLEVALGDGWYAGRIGMSQALSEDGRPRAVYGRRPALRLQVDIEYEDGTRAQVVTDETWRSALDGPIRFADMLDGVLIDTRSEPTVWQAVGLAKPRPEPAIVWQPNEPIRVVEQLSAIAITEPKPGLFVVDMGQNMPGWCRLQVTGKAGDEVRLRYVEMLNEDGTPYTANLRGAAQTDVFILRGGEQWLEPKFTYHGFRYVGIEGLTERPRLEDVEGVVFCSSAEEVGTFSCSDPMLTKLWSNIKWTQRANLMSVPTDCPQRDERLGWTGDILIFAPTACYQMNLWPFFTKWFADVRDAQADDGRYPDFAPHPYGRNRAFTGAPGWGDAGVFVPWHAYLTYGDESLLRDHFHSAVRYVDWVRSKNPDLIWRNARHNDYGDWLNGDTLIHEGWPKTGASVPREVFATIYFAESTRIVREMARVVGDKQEAERMAKLYDEIRRAFVQAFVNSDGIVEGGTQAGYALSLSFDLLPENRRAKALQHMIANIGAYGGHMSTGFHSSHRMMLELSRAGRDDLAYRLALHRTFPSWGYSIENGATTLWERWDGFVKGRGFQDPGMNSFNHWAFGAVGEWMMEVVAGLRRHPDAVAWRKALIAPRPGGGLTWAKAAYESISGQYEVAWRITDRWLTLDIAVPPNTEAEVRVPTSDPSSIDTGDSSPRVLGEARLLVGPGRHRIRCKI